MHPGSGPSDRHNDVLFPPIREHLLRAGFAVCSFDKRGVGGSTGRWQEAGIVDQADDLLACVAALRVDATVAGPVGIFGHSQGGWVVVEAAGRQPDIALAVTSSGPGVTPAVQERYSALRSLERAGATPASIDDALRDFDAVVTMMRTRVPFERARDRFGDRDGPFVPDDAAVWGFACSIIDYDPRPALERIRVPLLALFGSDDAVVPVDESVTVYREAVRPELLTVAVLPGDHRVQVGDPPAPTTEYLEALSSFVAASV
jgi:uncharacterized protein